MARSVASGCTVARAKALPHTFHLKLQHALHMPSISNSVFRFMLCPAYCVHVVLQEREREGERGKERAIGAPNTVMVVNYINSYSVLPIEMIEHGLKINLPHLMVT